LIVGASARSAAFSALRAGLHPWCIDLFGDADLRSICPTNVVSPKAYPEGLLQAARRAPAGPWIYTGALENRPDLIRTLAHERPLWGNDDSVLAVVRSPGRVEQLLRGSGVACPAVRSPAQEAEREKRWLVKPRASAGGSQIRFWKGEPLKGRCRSYLQEFIPGESRAALYVADGRQARLLGVTRQLVGESWLHAAPFHYCGSLGPLGLLAAEEAALQRLGDALMAGCPLRGLFGVDCIWCEGVPWPTEVNPRYTASVEVVEQGGTVPALALHRKAFDASAVDSAWTARPWSGPVVGKAILFARDALVFPNDGPWMSVLRGPKSLSDLPAFADIPPAGQAIDAGRPILTLFARAGSVAACLDELRRIAADLDHGLFAR
jgi:predicted ATP-grasp superfamily ATP-dependent carboligase